MTVQPVSEQLFEQFCGANAIPCSRVDTGVRRTPDYVITLGGILVTCEVKQIDPNAQDLSELAELRERGATGRHIPNRLRGKLKDVSAQLKDAAREGYPTLLVVYDNTPFKSYTDHTDVVQAMFGRPAYGYLPRTIRLRLSRSPHPSSGEIAGWGQNGIRQSA